MSGVFDLGKPSYLPDEDEDSLGDQTTNDSINIEEIEAIADELEEIAEYLDGWRIG